MRLRYTRCDFLSPISTGSLKSGARAPDPRELSIGIVHLGLGAFHRAHQAVYTQDALATGGSNSWGICGVTQRQSRPWPDLFCLRTAFTVSSSAANAARKYE